MKSMDTKKIEKAIKLDFLSSMIKRLALIVPQPIKNMKTQFMKMMDGHPIVALNNVLNL